MPHIRMPARYAASRLGSREAASALPTHRVARSTAQKTIAAAGKNTAPNPSKSAYTFAHAVSRTNQTQAPTTPPSHPPHPLFPHTGWRTTCRRSSAPRASASHSRRARAAPAPRASPGRQMDGPPVHQPTARLLSQRSQTCGSACRQCAKARAGHGGNAAREMHRLGPLRPKGQRVGAHLRERVGVVLAPYLGAPHRHQHLTAARRIPANGSRLGRRH